MLRAIVGWWAAAAFCTALLPGAEPALATPGACCSSTCGCTSVEPAACSAPSVFVGGVCGPTSCLGGVAWENGATDLSNGLVSHLGGQVPFGSKAADDFVVAAGTVLDVRQIQATVFTSSIPQLTRLRAEIWTDCGGCPGSLLYTLTGSVATERGVTVPPDLRVVDVRWTPASEVNASNRQVLLRAGRYWLSVHGVTDGQCSTMLICDVTYWAVSPGPLQAMCPKRINGAPGAPFGSYIFPAGCGAGGWEPIGGCCIPCVDLAFSISGCVSACAAGDCVPEACPAAGACCGTGGLCTSVVRTACNDPNVWTAGVSCSPTPCPPINQLPADIGHVIRAMESPSSVQTQRAVDDVYFAAQPNACGPWKVKRLEATVLTNVAQLAVFFEVYGGPPSGGPANAAALYRLAATSVVDTGQTTVINNRQVRVYRCAVGDGVTPLFSVASGQTLWVGPLVRSTGSVAEVAYAAGFNYGAVVPAGQQAYFQSVQNPLWTPAATLDAQFRDLAITVVASPPLPCPQDYNCQNGTDILDIFLFLADWFNGVPKADFNGIGGVEILDIFSFLAAWFSGCP